MVKDSLTSLKSLKMDPTTKSVQLKNKDLIVKVMHSLQDFASEKKIDCNFIILMASQLLGIDAEIDNQDICRKLFKDVVF